MKTMVKKTKTMGRGIFACKKFKKGDVIEISPCLNIENNDHLLIDTKLELYTFKNQHDADSSLIALGHGSLFNHSSNSNATYKYNPLQNVMTFKATKAIRKGSQIFINYGYDPVTEEQRRKNGNPNTKRQSGETESVRGWTEAAPCK